MNIIQELQQLDPRDPGRWPLAVRVGVAVLAFVVLSLAASYLFVWQEKDPQLTQKRAEELVLARLPHVDRRTVGYYVSVDEPERLSYKRYDWRNERADESIWIAEGPGEVAGAMPIEKEPTSIIAALQTKKYFHRLIVPPEVRSELLRELATGES